MAQQIILTSLAIVNIMQPTILNWVELIGLFLAWFICGVTLFYFFIGVPILFGIYTYKIIFYLKKNYPEIYENGYEPINKLYIPFPLGYIKKEFHDWLNQQDPKIADPLKKDIKQLRKYAILGSIWVAFVILCFVIAEILNLFGYHVT